MKILTSVVNNPIFVEIQFYTLQKYVKGEYEFIVFNDAKDFPDFTNGGDITIKSQIQDVCRRLNIQCIDIPNDRHRYNREPSIRTADSMNYIAEYQKTHPDQYLVLDSDMFLVDFLDIQKYLSYDSGIVLQTRLNNIHYFWNGLYYFDTSRMKYTELLNWNCAPHCDTGGMMQEWLGKHRDENGEYSKDICLMKHLSSGRWTLPDLPETLKGNEKLVDFLKTDPRNENEQLFCELYDNVFLHYRCGGNWRQEGLDMHKKLSEKLKQSLL